MLHELGRDVPALGGKPPAECARILADDVPSPPIVGVVVAAVEEAEAALYGSYLMSMGLRGGRLMICSPADSLTGAGRSRRRYSRSHSSLAVV